MAGQGQDWIPTHCLDCYKHSKLLKPTISKCVRADSEQNFPRADFCNELAFESPSQLSPSLMSKICDDGRSNWPMWVKANQSNLRSAFTRRTALKWMKRTHRCCCSLVDVWNICDKEVCLAWRVGVIVRLVPGKVPKAAGTPKEMGHGFVPLFSFVDFASTWPVNHVDVFGRWLAWLRGQWSDSLAISQNFDWLFLDGSFGLCGCILGLRKDGWEFCTGSSQRSLEAGFFGNVLYLDQGWFSKVNFEYLWAPPAE